MTTANQLAGYASSLQNFRNRIINGNFDVWQRGNSPFTSTSVNEYSVDRFRTEGYSLSTTISQQVFTANQTDVPDYPTYYCRVATSAAPSAGQYWAFQQRIEAPQNISYGTYTLSFWVRCTSGSLSAGAFKYGLSDSLQSSPALSTTWTKLTHTFDISSFSGSGSIYASIYLIYLTSSSPSSFSVDIAQVQLEEGTVATPFEHRPIGLELGLCQRYCQKSYDIGTVPGTNVSSTYFGLHFSNGICDSSTNQNVPFTIHINPTMRAQPTFYYYSVEGTVNRYNTFTGGGMARAESSTPLSGFYRGESKISGYVTPGTGNSYGFCYLLTSEL